MYAPEDLICVLLDFALYGSYWLRRLEIQGYPDGWIAKDLLLLISKIDNRTSESGFQQTRR